MPYNEFRPPEGWYNYNRKRINRAAVIDGVLKIVLVFVVCLLMFIGG